MMQRILKYEFKAEELLKNKIQRRHFKILIGFINRFMIWATSYLVTRRELQKVKQNERFL